MGSNFMLPSTPPITRFRFLSFLQFSIPVKLFTLSAEIVKLKVVILGKNTNVDLLFCEHY